MVVIRTVHARSLRAIGQSLEVTGIGAFEIENDGGTYIVRSDSMTPNEVWILHNCIDGSSLSRRIAKSASAEVSLRVTSADIERLDAQGQKKRGGSPSQLPLTLRLSQLLRTIGDHLDRTEVSAFHIAWLPRAIEVDYKEQRGEADSRTFTAEKLQQLGSHARLRRANRKNW